MLHGFAEPEEALRQEKENEVFSRVLSDSETGLSSISLYFYMLESSKIDEQGQGVRVFFHKKRAGLKSAPILRNTYRMTSMFVPSFKRP